jgi:hypothetical protein
VLFYFNRLNGSSSIEPSKQKRVALNNEAMFEKLKAVPKSVGILGPPCCKK